MTHTTMDPAAETTGRKTGDGNPPTAPHGDAGAAHDEHGIPTDIKPASGLAIAMAVIALVLILAALAVVGTVPHMREVAAARKEAAERANLLPVVEVASPELSSGTHDVVLPCDVKANQQTAIYTRTNGYLKHWYFDIGQHVNQGQLMADIEAPEVDAELAQSQAALKQNDAAVNKANADEALARVTLQRYHEAQKRSPGSVTQEDIDTHQSQYDDAVAALRQAQANVEAARANVQQLTVTQGFEKVIAPFSGTVTARNYDVGALLSPAAGKEIFDLEQTNQLRVFVNVPQEYANDVKMNTKAKLFVRNFPATPFEGVISRTAGAVDPTTRTLAVQIDFPNKDGKLFAGEYGEIHLPVSEAHRTALIPTSALIFNAQATGLQVAVVVDGNKIHMKSIKTARDFGTAIEVTDGLSETDRIVTNPSERVSEGAIVNAVNAPSDAAKHPASKPTQKPVQR